MNVILRRRIEDVEEPFPSIADLKHAGHVATSIAVIWGAPHCAQSIVIEHLVSLLTELVRTKNVCHRVHREELLHHLCSEGVTGTARRQREFVTLRVRVGPNEIGHGTLVRYLPEPVDDLDLVDGVDGRREATVYAEDLIVDDDREGEKIEHVCEVVPHIRVAVLARAFRVETVRLGDAPRLVIPADQMDSVRVAELETNKE